MANYSEAFLKRTIEVWQPYSPTPLTLEDAREITANMTALFSFLLELDKKYGEPKEKETSHESLSSS
jgi:hypothetical protein